MKTIVGIGVAVGLLAACIGAWFGYWALQRANTEQQYGVNTETQQYQASLISQERDRVTGWYASTDTAQKRSIASQFCAVYDSLTRVPADLAEAHSNICTA